MIMRLLTLLLLFPTLSVFAQDENIRASGILPYIITNDSVYILLGYDNDKPGWTDFGGGREWVTTLDEEKRLETPAEIAMREFFEECRKVYGTEEIRQNFDPDNYIPSANGVYRSYLVKMPYRSREEFRKAPIPADEKFAIFREKSDFYWITLSELKSIIRSGGNTLPGSPNGGVIFKYFYDTLVIVLKDDSIDEKFK